MINRRRSGARGTPAKVNATAGLEASEGVNSASVSDGSHESVYLCPFYVLTPEWGFPASNRITDALIRLRSPHQCHGHRLKSEQETEGCAR